MNYSEIEEVLPYSNVFYDASMKKMIQSLVGLQHLKVDREIEDEHKFIEFLKCLSTADIRIRELVLINSLLDQNFFTYYLNYLCPFLRMLEIKGGANAITNLNFLLNLEHLQILQIKCPLEFSFIDKLYKRLKRLKKISFIFEGEWMFIERKNADHHYYSLYDASYRSKMCKMASVIYKYGFNGSKTYNANDISEIDLGLLLKPASSNKIRNFLNRLL